MTGRSLICVSLALATQAPPTGFCTGRGWQELHPLLQATSRALGWNMPSLQPGGKAPMERASVWPGGGVTRRVHFSAGEEAGAGTVRLTMVISKGARRRSLMPLVLLTKPKRNRGPPRSRSPFQKGV